MSHEIDHKVTIKQNACSSILCYAILSLPLNHAHS